jgi:hypothetical protein
MCISDRQRNRNMVEFLGIWSSAYNLGFNYGEFATIKNQPVCARRGLSDGSQD